LRFDLCISTQQEAHASAYIALILEDVYSNIKSRKKNMRNLTKLKGEDGFEEL